MTTLTRRWFPKRMPDDTRVRRVHGFCFDSAGRVLLGTENEEGAPCTLPGGVPKWEGFDCLGALTGECRVKYGVSITRAVYLGYWQILGESPELPDAELLLAARITTFHRAGPVRGDRSLVRLLTPIREVADRLGWSEEGPVQVASTVATSIFGMSPSKAQQTVRRA
ncbi:hypothetical protein ACGFYZ_33130 [Streptomyces sp. NPDC048330]|uniref:hypothetical protein n=1 Tax=Streptomyces sp. NPDC048330 TaxID=3365533 RepID=UPI003720BD74